MYLKWGTVGGSVVDPKFFSPDPEPDPTMILISDPDLDPDWNPAC